MKRNFFIAEKRRQTRRRKIKQQQKKNVRDSIAYNEKELTETYSKHFQTELLFFVIIF